jgi:thiamine-phosphate pyrophosphorylase
MTLAEVSTQLNSANNNKLPPIMFLTDEHRVQDPLTICRYLPPGTGIILRDYNSPNRKDLAAQLSKIATKYKLILFVGDDMELALKIGAKGVHYRENTIQGGEARKNTNLIITSSAHSFAAIQKASEAGADAVILSPVFKTKSNLNKAPLGISLFSKWVAKSPLPVYPLGGITSHNAHLLLSSKAAGLAAIEGVVEEFYSPRET